MASASLGSEEAARVLAVCFATQGNGNYFAATLGWLAAAIEARADEADALIEKDGVATGLQFQCAGGASSGAFAVLVLGRLLQNPALNPGQKRILTPKEARLLAASLRYVALSTDVNAYEVLMGSTNAITEFIGGQLERIPYPFAPEPKVQWWTEQVVNPDLMVVHFTSILLLADYLKPEMVEAPLNPKDWPEAERNLAATLGFKKISDILRVPEIPAETSADFKTLQSMIGRQAALIGREAETLVTRLFPLGAYKARFFNGAYDRAHPLFKKILEAPLPEGFCTYVWGSLVKGPEAVPATIPTFDSLQIFALCSPFTLNQVFGSQRWRADQEQDQRLSSVHWTATRNQRTAMTLSIREPRLMRETYGPVGQAPFEFDNVFEGRPEIDRQPSQPWMLDLGGFVDRRSIGSLQIYILENQMNELKARGIQVLPRLELFGKPNADGSYGEKVIKGILAANEQESLRNASNWNLEVSRSCQQLSKPLAGETLVLQTTAYNWDSVGRLPPLNWTDLYVARSWNARMLQAPLKPIGLAFDPLFTKIPVPTQPGNSCP